MGGRKTVITASCWSVCLCWLLFFFYSTNDGDRFDDDDSEIHVVKVILEQGLVT